MKGYNPSYSSAATGTTNTSLSDSPPSGGEVNWVTHSPTMVTAVQNQGQCGSCWSFSASGCISSMRAIAGYPLVDYAEQQLVDCDTTCNGCSGGLMDNAFAYTMSHPLETSADYPYTASVGTCKYEASKGTGSISSYVNVPKNNADALKNALASKGPISVAVQASQPA